jgi:hypothetical protein
MAPRGPAARRGDEVTRDETAWTWWTLPFGISGCLARRYRKCIPISSHSCWTSRNMQSPGLGQGRQRLVVASGYQEPEIRPCSSSMTASRTPQCRCGCVFPPTRVARAVGLFWQAARVTADLDAGIGWQRTGGRGRPARGGRRARATALDTAEVRQWARAQGIEVKDRGRIPAELVVRARRRPKGRIRNVADHSRTPSQRVPAVTERCRSILPANMGAFLTGAL